MKTPSKYCSLSFLRSLEQDHYLGGSAEYSEEETQILIASKFDQLVNRFELPGAKKRHRRPNRSLIEKNTEKYLVQIRKAIRAQMRCK